MRLMPAFGGSATGRHNVQPAPVGSPIAQSVVLAEGIGPRDEKSGRVPDSTGYEHPNSRGEAS
jgi:hypothetical protein